MAKQLPHGFKSFMSFYHFMDDRHPDMLKHKTIILKTFDFELGIQEYRIGTQTLIKKVFQEIMSKRLTERQVLEAIQRLYCYGPDRISIKDYENISDILLFISKK